MKDRAIILAIILGVIVLLVSHRSDAVEQDKQQHIAVSALIAIPAAMYLEGTDHPVMYSIAVAMIPGVLKEIYDARHPKTHTASGADLVADLVGATSGALIGHGISLQANRSYVSFNYSTSF